MYSSPTLRRRPTTLASKVGGIRIGGGVSYRLTFGYPTALEHELYVYVALDFDNIQMGWRTYEMGAASTDKRVTNSSCQPTKQALLLS